MSSKQLIAAQSTGSSVPGSSTTPAPPSEPRPLPILPLGVFQADAFLSHLHRCMQTPSGIDTVLQIVWASSRLTGILLDRHAPQRSARELVALALGLRGGRENRQKVMPLAQRLKAIGTLMAEVRAMMRLWGLLAMYLWARRLVVSLSPTRRSSASASTTTNTKPGNASENGITAPVAPPADGKPFWLNITQLVGSAIFQATDNINLLSRHGVLRFTPAQQGSLARFGVRAWSVFLGTELGRLAFELSRRDILAAEERAAVVKIRKSLVQNLAWAPIIISGAVGVGLVGELTGALLAMVPSVMMMRDLWRDTA